jgi:hypothetical protein
MNVIVEDILAKSILEEVLSRMGDATKNIFNVKYNPGGESVLKNEFITVYCRDEVSKNYIFFDGDQKPISLHFNWRDAPISEITSAFMKQKIREQTKEDISFSVDGGIQGGNQIQEMELRKKYLDYYLSNVFYFPQNIPEEIIWDVNYASELLRISIVETDKFNDLKNEMISLKSTKEKFAKLTLYLHGKDSAEEVRNTHKLFLKYWLQQENDDYRYIEQIISKIINRNNN